MRKKKRKASWGLINLEGCPDRLGHANETPKNNTHNGVFERESNMIFLYGERRREIDIVLTEFDLPDMDGLVFIEKVLEIRRLPVFVLSTFESFEEVVADNFVVRPKSIHKLMNIPVLTIAHVANHLQRYRV